MNIDTSRCKRRVMKVGDNHVIVQYILYDTDNKEVVVKEEEYGSTRIESELDSAQKEYDTWNKLTQKEIDAKKLTAQKRVQELNEIQSEMAKEISISK